MAKTFHASGAPTFHTSDRVSATYGQTMGWPTSGRVDRVTVRHMSKNARRKAARYGRVA